MKIWTFPGRDLSLGGRSTKPFFSFFFTFHVHPLQWPLFLPPPKVKTSRMQCQIHEIPEGDLLLGDLQSRDNRREGKGFFSRKLSGNSCCCTFCSCCARKMQREKERGWDEGWAGNEFRMAFSRDYAFRFYNGERRVPRHVSILIGFDDRPAFRKGYWWKIEASAVRFLSWKRIDTFEFNLLRRKPLQYCVHAAYENYSSTVSPLIK